MENEHDVDCGCQEYNELSRRQFVAAGASMSALAVFPDWLPRISMAENYAANRDIIVSIFMRGGADGLSLVAPFGDPAYYTSRSSIAIPRPDSGDVNKGISLDGFFMFPQAMSSLLPAYTATDLLIVHGTGSLNNSRSHFDAQRYMEVGKPADPSVITGWLGRHLNLMPALKPGAPLRALGIANGLQKTLVGAPNTLPIGNPANYSVGGATGTQAQRLAFMDTDYGSSADTPLRSAALDATATVALLKSVNFTGYAPANGAAYPTSGFGRALRSVAVLIKQDVGIEAAQVDIGGWDTHSAQDPLTVTGSMFRTMTDFSTSLAAFYADVIATGFPVTVVAFSEFGRNVRENGSNGTDHGRGAVMFAMGKGIVGGRVYTKVPWVGLDRANLEQGQDLKVTVDLRDILSEIVQNRLGNPNIGTVFPTWTPSFVGVTR